MTFKSNLITERQRAVLETMRMRLTEKLALAYLKGEGFEMSDTTLYREKKKLEDIKLKRLYHIAQIGFQDQHLETIDQYEMGFSMMWQNVLRERDPYKQNSMIRDILMLKPYLSAYYEATKYIVEKKQQQEPVIVLESDQVEEEESDNNNGESNHQENNSLPTIKRENQEQSIRDPRFNSNNRKF